MDDAHLRLHRFLPASRANGPGVRAVVWAQGCSLACPGCYNPETHGRRDGETLAVDALATRILDLGDSIDGLTVSGGEPLQQLPALLALLRRVRAESSLSTLLFTGFRFGEIARMPRSDELLASLDVLIAGRYDDGRRVATGLRGSANKTVHFLTGRYAQADLDRVPTSELIVTPDGDVVSTGIDPVRW